MNDLNLLEILAASGDTATLIIAWALWKLDNRISILESQK